MAKKPLIPVTPSSGNVFADIGVPEPEEELAKAQLASRIREIVRGSRMTQVAAAAVMGIDQPKVSALLSGRLGNFSSERLMRLLTRLGQDVEIVVRSKPRRRLRGRIRVVQEARPYMRARPPVRSNTRSRTRQSDHARPSSTSAQAGVYIDHSEGAGVIQPPALATDLELAL